MTANLSQTETAILKHDLLASVTLAYGRFIDGTATTDLFADLLERILRVTGSEFGFIAEVVKPAPSAGELRPLACSPIDWASLGTAVSSGTVVSSATQLRPATAAFPRIPAPMSTLELPIHRDDRVVGMLCLLNRPGGYPAVMTELLDAVTAGCAKLFDAIAREGRRQTRDVILKRSNSFLSALLSNIPSGILVEDADGAIFAINQVYCDLFGKQQLALMLEGEPCAGEFEENKEQYEDGNAFIEWRSKCLQSGVGVSGQEFRLSNDRVFQQSYVPIYIEDENGTVYVNHFWIFNDVTPLHHAIAVAQEAARVKSEFLATMSHEIRTPMNGVLGMLYMLSKTPLDSKQQRFLDTATGSGELLLKIINDILDFSKLEVGKLELENIPFDLVTLLEDSVSLMAKIAQEKNLELICSLSRDLPRTVVGDPIRLRQILTNLIGNAIKFTEVGDVVVYVAPQENNHILFGVRDTGIGISEEHQHRLFQAFSQMDSSHTRKYGGTGLGLAISQQLVKAMGGEIRAASAIGTGSDFSFDIVLPTPEAERIVAHDIPTLLSKKRVLIVGNYAVSRRVVHQVLQSWHVQDIVEAGSDEAIQTLQQATDAEAPFDFLVFDLQFENHYAISLADTIRYLFGPQGLKIIVITSAERTALAAVADVCLAKPLRRSELFNALQGLLGMDEDTPQQAQEDYRWDFSGKRLLVVDDNLINQDVAREILCDTGFEVDIRDNGLSAIQAVQDKEYDAVLMDIQMPVMDGMQATRKIRGLGGKFSALPIFAMTANALSEDILKSLEAGMNGHLSKPFKPVVVFRLLAEFLNVKPHKPRLPLDDALSVPGSVTGDRATAKADCATVKTDCATAKADCATAKTDGSAADNASTPLPQQLPGLDLVDGLSRVRGNEKLYWRLLKSFRQQHDNTLQTLESFVAQRQWSDAMHLAHSVKGTSGNLGAAQLYGVAATLENACKQEDVVGAASSLEALKDILAEVLNSIDSLTTPESEPATSPLSSQDSNAGLSDVVTQMLQALENDLGEAEQCLQRMQTRVQGDAQREWLRHIENALNRFDTDQVESLLRNIPPST